MALTKEDWTLLAIACAGESGLTPAQLQKSLFLLEKNSPRKISNFYQFKPYNYGPFDKTIYLDANVLASENLVKVNGVDGQSWSKYHITEQGLTKAKKLKSELDPPLSSYLERVVHWAQRLSFSQLIASIYKRYPEYKVNSVFKD